jgi:hypothetical protein
MMGAGSSLVGSAGFLEPKRKLIVNVNEGIS